MLQLHTHWAYTVIEVKRIIIIIRIKRKQNKTPDTGKEQETKPNISSQMSLMHIHPPPPVPFLLPPRPPLSPQKFSFLRTERFFPSPECVLWTGFYSQRKGQTAPQLGYIYTALDIALTPKVFFAVSLVIPGDTLTRLLGGGGGGGTTTGDKEEEGIGSWMCSRVAVTFPLLVCSRETGLCGQYASCHFGSNRLTSESRNS